MYVIEIGAIRKGHFVPSDWEPLVFKDYWKDVENAFDTVEQARETLAESLEDNFAWTLDIVKGKRGRAFRCDNSFARIRRVDPLNGRTVEQGARNVR